MGFLRLCAKRSRGALVIGVLGLQACGTDRATQPSSVRGGAAGDVGSGGLAGSGASSGAAAQGGSRAELEAGHGASGQSAAGDSSGGEFDAGGSLAAGHAGFGASGSGQESGVNEGGGPSGGSGTGGNAAEGDPLPTEPNLTGLIHHSTRWLLIGKPSSNYVRDIQLLDLSDQQVYDANPDKTLNIIGTLSPDGRTYFFSNGDGTAPSERIIRLEPDGFVPAHQLEDYVGVAGAYRVLSWSFDSRFAVVSRGAAPSSVEIVDMRLGKRLATETFSAIVGEFAPKGYFYYYSAANVAGFEPKYGRVAASGSSPRISLPADAKDMMFDPEGSQLFYALGTYPETDRLFMISLADGSQREISAIEDGELLNAYDSLPVAGDSVVVAIHDEAQTIGLRRRVFLDDHEPAVTLTDPARYATRYEHSRDNNLHAQMYTSKELDLIRVEPYARQPLSAAWVPSSMWDNIGFIGGYAYLGGSDGLHLARFNDVDEVEDVVLGAGRAAHACASDFGYTPLHKLAFVQGDGEALVFVDLDATPPAIRGSIQPSTAGYKLECPLWGDNDTALAFTESDGTNANTYVTRWLGVEPEAPALVGANLGRIYAVMYR